MKLIVGLGNPGQKYATTRHNVGFSVIDFLIDTWKCSEKKIKFHAHLFSGSLENEQICLVKPQTFMNLSGESIGPLFQFYQCQPSDLIVIHDDLDLQPLRLRFKQGGGTGGHNGLKSIDSHLGNGNQNYYRIRIGIGHPFKTQFLDLPNPSLKTSISHVENFKGTPADYVLQPFEPGQKEALLELLPVMAQSIELIIKGKLQEAIRQLHHVNDSKQR